MALSIKTEEADRLARLLADMTGETMTQAVTLALRERIDRLTAMPATQAQYVERAKAFADVLRERYNLSKPISREEWDEACGDSAA